MEIFASLLSTTEMANPVMVRSLVQTGESAEKRLIVDCEALTANFTTEVFDDFLPESLCNCPGTA